MDPKLTARRAALHAALREGRRRQHVEEAHGRTPAERLAAAARLVAFADAAGRERGRPWSPAAESFEPWPEIRARHRRLLAAPTRATDLPDAPVGP